MSYGGAGPAFRPIAWVYLPSGDCTVRWQRGDTVAYIFEGKQFDTYPDEPLKVKVLATIRVLPKGWTDTAHVRRIGEAWVKEKRQRCPKCGVYS